MRSKWVKEQMRKNVLLGFFKNAALFVVQKKNLVGKICLGILIAVILGIAGSVWWQGREAKAMSALDEAHAMYAKYGKASEAKGLYEKVREDYGYTKSAAEALFYIGNCYYKLEDYDKAQRTYEQYVEDYHKTILTPFAYE
ncbi:MAG: tetratricopeptide repeat protein, partial [bacterium]